MRVFLLALIIGAQPIATDLYLPAMQDLARELPALTWLGFSLASTSTLTFFTLFYGLGQVMGGQWADRFGRRNTLLSALAIYTVCGLGAIFAPSMAFLLALRSVQGLATAAIVVTARAAIRDTFSVEDAPRVMSQIFTRLGFVVVLCPLLGAVLATHGGWRIAMAASTLYGAALLAWCAWQFPETLRSASDTSHDAALADIPVWQLLQTLWASASFRRWTLIASVTISGIFTFLTISSSIFIGQFGFSAYAYGAALVGGACIFVCSNLLCTRLLQSHSTSSIAKLGAGLSLGAGAIQILALVFTPMAAAPLLLPLGLLIGQYFYTLGHGMLQSCALASSTADFPHMAGRASAWSGLIMMVTAFMVSQIAASFMDARYSYGAWPLAVTIVFCGAGLMGLTLNRKSRL